MNTQKHYAADVGTWESGQVHRFAAKNREEATAIAFKLGIVIQITELENSDARTGATFYDFANGRIDN